jgi:hypothetical protein
VRSRWGTCQRCCPKLDDGVHARDETLYRVTVVAVRQDVVGHGIVVADVLAHPVETPFHYVLAVLFEQRIERVDAYAEVGWPEPVGFLCSVLDGIGESRPEGWQLGGRRCRSPRCRRVWTAHPDWLPRRTAALRRG